MQEEQRELRQLEDQIASENARHNEIVSALRNKARELRSKLNFLAHGLKPGVVVVQRGQRFLVHSVEDHFYTGSIISLPRLEVRRQTKNGWHKTVTYLYAWCDNGYTVEKSTPTNT
jgi:hypothetical protein